jgi:hypothetical protein
LSLREAVRAHAAGDTATAHQITAWLRMTAPSSAHPSASRVAPHWPALHRRVAVLARRIERQEDPFLIPSMVPAGLDTRFLRDRLADLMAIGVAIEHDYVALTRKSAGLPAHRVTVEVFLAHAPRFAEACHQLATRLRAEAAIARTTLDAQRDALSASLDPAVESSVEALAASSNLEAADPSDDAAAVWARLHQPTAPSIFVPATKSNDTAVKVIVRTCVELRELVETAEWLDACRTQLESQILEFQQSPRSRLIDTIPFRVFVFGLYEDARQLCSRIAASHAMQASHSLMHYPQSIRELSFEIDAV